jgi:hypothetical protein
MSSIQVRRQEASGGVVRHGQLGLEALADDMVPTQLVLEVHGLGVSHAKLDVSDVEDESLGDEVREGRAGVQAALAQRRNGS